MVKKGKKLWNYYQHYYYHLLNNDLYWFRNFTSTSIVQEKEVKDLKKKTRTLKSEDNYHDSRIFICDQLILYLSKYVDHNRKIDMKDENINSETPEIGMEILKKNDESDIFKFKGIKNKPRKGKKHMKEENLEFKSLKHSFDIFQSFHSIKVCSFLYSFKMKYLFLGICS